MKTTLATSQNPFMRRREREIFRKTKEKGNKGCVITSHCDLAIYIEKYLNAKEEL
jgi:hypothetical protein